VYEVYRKKLTTFNYDSIITRYGNVVVIT
jgi:hypothetical protein